MSYFLISTQKFVIIRFSTEVFVFVRNYSFILFNKLKIYLLVDAVGSISRGSTTTVDSSSESIGRG